MVDSFSNAVVTITGGTGSFGSTMARHLLASEIGELRIFSRDETKQDAMRHAFRDARIKFFIGDVRDEKSVSSVIRGSNYVFHAAALKQVPSCEFFPLEAVKTNVIGSSNVIRSAIDHGVDSIVCLSTDKAVYPINAMGISKAMMEKTAIALAREFEGEATKIAITRYGNVMASRGSVIPLFITQIKEGLPITVTNPNMTRFLMSLDESVDLVKYAFSNGESGDLFIRKAPAATVHTIALALRDILGKPNHPVKVIGVRHGEKLYESLLSSEERSKSIEYDKYYRVPIDTRDLDYESYFETGEQLSLDPEAYTSHNANRLEVKQVKELLLGLDVVRNAL